MMTNVSRKVDFLPITSPNLPNTKVPNRRTIKPTANVASVESKAAVELVLGKNLTAMMVDKLPKM